MEEIGLRRLALEGHLGLVAKAEAEFEGRNWRRIKREVNKAAKIERKNYAGGINRTAHQFWRATATATIILSPTEENEALVAKAVELGFYEYVNE